MLKIDPSEIQLREFNPETDRAFVLASWLKSYKLSEFAHAIPSRVYYTWHQKIIDQILSVPTNQVTIVCDPDDSSHILGFMVNNTQTPIIHYIYVKHAFRRRGLAAYLMSLMPPSENLVCTHKPKLWVKLSRQYKLSYNPYVIT